MASCYSIFAEDSVIENVNKTVHEIEACRQMNQAFKGILTIALTSKLRSCPCRHWMLRVRTGDAPKWPTCGVRYLTRNPSYKDSFALQRSIESILVGPDASEDAAVEWPLVLLKPSIDTSSFKPQRNIEQPIITSPHRHASPRILSPSPD
jgi:hypothetical protein